MNRYLLTLALLPVCAVAYAQTPDAHKPVPQPRAAYYIDSKVLTLSPIVPPPPAQDSEAAKAELAELHRIEETRTPAQVAAAQADEKDESIFVFRTVLGENFRAEDLPLTAAFAAHVHGEESVVGNALKASFKRPRPYQLDSTLHPVCGTTEAPNSYPSGHSLSGYLAAFALIQIVPEKSREILDRADDYARNRMVCGVHYRSDTVASRDIAYAVFGYMMATPRFQIELAAARAETRRKLGLN
jgi:acid phosphatase (class A)